MPLAVGILLIKIIAQMRNSEITNGISCCLHTSGWLEDHYGSWDVSFILTGCLLLASALLMAIEPLLEKLFRIKKPEEPNEQAAIDQLPLRIRNKSSPPLADDTGSLLEEDVDVSFTSARISRIYRPYEPEKPPRSPDRTSAPVISPSDV